MDEQMRARGLATGLAAVALILIAGTACGSKPAPPAAPVLQSRETFDWSGEKISFSMPPSGWQGLPRRLSAARGDEDEQRARDQDRPARARARRQ
jgi:hypothetical protein